MHVLVSFCAFDHRILNGTKMENVGSFFEYVYTMVGMVGTDCIENLVICKSFSFGCSYCWCCLVWLRILKIAMLRVVNDFHWDLYLYFYIFER